MILSFVVEQRATAHKAIVRLLQQHLLFGCQLAMMLVNMFHTLEQLLVQHYVVRMLGEDGTELLRQLVQLVIGFGRQHARENG